MKSGAPPPGITVRSVAPSPFSIPEPLAVPKGPASMETPKLLGETAVAVRGAAYAGLVNKTEATVNSPFAVLRLTGPATVLDIARNG